MKIIFRTAFFATFLFVSLCSYGQKKALDPKLKVKSCTVFEETYEDDEKGTSQKELFTRYDAQSNVLEEIEYDKDGKEKSHILYEYDKDNNKIKESYIKPNGSKDKVVEFIYLNGLKTEKIVYYSNGKIKSKKKYVYQFVD